MMKSFCCIAGVACMIILASCGSDSSSGPASDVSKTKISIDESSQTITSYVNYSYDFCVYDSVGNRFDWKRSLETDLDTFDIHYLFKGDTLVLFEETDYGSVFVGGKANSLYGTWKGLENCEYVARDDEIDCFDSENLYGLFSSYHQITIHKDFVESKVVYSLPDDYTNSAWMTLFYTGLDEKSFSVEPRYVFVSDTVSAEKLKGLGIEVKSQSKSKISFVFDSKNVSVEFVDVKGNDYNDLSYTANVQVDDKTCSLLFARTDVSENLCSVENADYLDLEGYATSDTSFTYAYRYYKDNSDEFFECLNAAFGFEAKVVDERYYEILYKKQDRASIREANWKRMERIAGKLSGLN